MIGGGGGEGGLSSFFFAHSFHWDGWMDLVGREGLREASLPFPYPVLSVLFSRVGELSVLRVLLLFFFGKWLVLRVKVALIRGPSATSYNIVLG